MKKSLSQHGGDLFDDLFMPVQSSVTPEKFSLVRNSFAKENTKKEEDIDTPQRTLTTARAAELLLNNTIKGHTYEWDSRRKAWVAVKSADERGADIFGGSPVSSDSDRSPQKLKKSKFSSMIDLRSEKARNFGRWLRVGDDIIVELEGCSELPCRSDGSKPDPFIVARLLGQSEIANVLLPNSKPKGKARRGLHIFGGNKEDESVGDGEELNDGKGQVTVDNHDGTVVAWPERPDATKPSWGTVREFVDKENQPFVCTRGSRLQFELFDRNLSRKGAVAENLGFGKLFYRSASEVAGEVAADGSQLIAVGMLDLQNKPCDKRLATELIGAEMDTSKDVESVKKRSFSCSISFRLLRPPTALLKRVWLIRHGESEWNRAMHNKMKLLNLIGYDHPLSVKGIRQATNLWDSICMLPQTISIQTGEAPSEEALKDWHHFMNASVIFSSPLTRALQTCMLCLEGHPTMQKDGLRLTSDAREVKGRGGLDCIGVATGSSIRERALRCLSEAGCASDETLGSAGSVEIDCGDTKSEWWTLPEHKDTQEEIHLRIEDLLRRLKYAQGVSAIVVGHSLLFRMLAGRFQHPSFAQLKPEFASDLRRFKMQNCGVLELTLDFSNDIKECIIDGRMMFGTDLVRSDDPSYREENQEKEKEAVSGNSSGEVASNNNDSSSSFDRASKKAASKIGGWARRGFGALKSKFQKERKERNVAHSFVVNDEDIRPIGTIDFIAATGENPFEVRSEEEVEDLIFQETRDEDDDDDDESPQLGSLSERDLRRLRKASSVTEGSPPPLPPRTSKGKKMEDHLSFY
eukprot:g4543.t1